MIYNSIVGGLNLNSLTQPLQNSQNFTSREYGNTNISPINKTVTNPSEKFGKGSPRRVDDLLYGPEDWMGGGDNNAEDNMMFPDLAMDSPGNDNNSDEEEDKDFNFEDNDNDEEMKQKQKVKESYHYRRLKKALQQKPNFREIIEAALEESGLLQRYEPEDIFVNSFIR